MKCLGSRLETAGEVLGGYRVWLQLLLSSTVRHSSCSQVLQYFQGYQYVETCQIGFSEVSCCLTAVKVRAGNVLEGRA